jgi:hypothetical protein
MITESAAGEMSRPRAQTNPTDIRRFLDVIMAEDGIIEVREPDVPFHGTVIGYFDLAHKEDAVKAIASLSGKARAVYYILNPVRPDLLARADNRLRDHTPRGESVSDTDILALPACYVIYFDGRIVYFGQTNNLSKWLTAGHGFRMSTASNSTVTKWVIPRSVKVKAHFGVKFGDWAMRELRLIRQLRPEFNISGLGKPRRPKIGNPSGNRCCSIRRDSRARRGSQHPEVRRC